MATALVLVGEAALGAPTAASRPCVRLLLKSVFASLLGAGTQGRYYPSFT